MSFLDHIFSSSFWFTVIVTIWIFGFIGLGFLKPFKNKNMNMAFKGFTFIMAGVIMILPMFFYYGLAGNFETIKLGRTTLSLEEKYERGSDGPSETVHRLTVLDKKTGERKDRFYIGYVGELLDQKGDTVVYFYNYDLYVMNAATMTAIYHIKKDEWAAQYPELAEGVDQVSDNQHSNDRQKLYITIHGKNGNYFWFDPYTKQMSAVAPSEAKLPGIYTTGYELYLERADGSYKNTILGYAYTENSSRKKIVPGDRFKKMFGSPADETFIEPWFMCIDTVKKCFVFRHYKTIDKKKAWIEARDFNFKLLWKKDDIGLDAEDTYESDYYGNQFGVNLYENGLLYFNISGYMLCMEPKSGELKWKARL